MPDRPARGPAHDLRVAVVDSDDVARYLAAVRGGRAADAELVVEFRRRYEVIGGSPLIPHHAGPGSGARGARSADGTRVRAAMRFSEPSIATALAELAAEGVGDVVGIILSPQYSPLLMGGYARDVAAARAAHSAERAAVARRGRLAPASRPSSARSRARIRAAPGHARRSASRATRRCC